MNRADESIFVMSVLELKRGQGTNGLVAIRNLCGESKQTLLVRSLEFSVQSGQIDVFSFEVQCLTLRADAILNWGKMCCILERGS